MIDYESLKLFYIGKQKVDGNTLPLVYENKDLLTHAAIIGMTGSGKTGLGITLLEEATIDNIPSIIIDPKGDMTNLLLSFEDAKAQDFEPWIDESEVIASNLSKKELAQKKSQAYKDGITKDFQSLDRVAKFKNSANFYIYTPASDAGIRVSVLSSFKAPPKELREDSELFVSIVSSMVASIFALLGEKNSDGSKESLLLNSIFMHNFYNDKDLTLQDLVTEVLNPPFTKVGAFDLETFCSQNDRLKFSLKLNNLIANPAFNSWIEGESLNISKMLYDSDSKARVNIFSIAHLNDAQRMFFVTILLNEILSWMRRLEGVSSLKALLYMDEIFGYFPPSSNPPSKAPMLTLLKQARSFGVGIVLSTQNPVDIDYKGLSNIGTWFIGRLQTKQDIAKVIDGLSSATSQLDKSQITQMITSLEKRNFILNNVHRNELVVFETRYALSYLKGPISKEGIATLMADKKSIKKDKIQNSSNIITKPTILSDIPQKYIYKNGSFMQPYIRLSATVKFNSKEIDTTKKLSYSYYLDSKTKDINFEDYEEILGGEERAKDNLEYFELPPFINNNKELRLLERDFSDYIYRNIKYTTYKNDELKLKSKQDESIDDFRLRIKDTLNSILDLELEKIKAKFQKESVSLEEKLSRAYAKLQKEQSEANASTTNTLLSVGSALLGAFFGSKASIATTISKVATGARGASKTLKERGDVTLAQDEIENIKNSILELKDNLSTQIEKLKESYSLDKFEIQTYDITPKRGDIYDIKSELIWVG